ncbi:MAG: radical SAM family heme chaperone HemW [Candidatus Pseudobacter hemicellulosilyticus]|uniref:Heme chaperone HemW n=1 Tax=Candidatus Pseudobacter hemicellulosilyticus TaxID=3121375 RepID=A0AAJ6BGS1_9BACT|nr:MAG: radical SAM family heme chaperone HemW [Pseudobacter sp.]
MAGIYIHIPFCRRACHYCNFHFSTSGKQLNDFVAALLKEIRLQESFLAGETVETVYFGGGTPSLLPLDQLNNIIGELRQHFNIGPEAELTLEANPDDLNEAALAGWRSAGINRLSIGIQSFFEEDLRWMNRAHTAQQAIDLLPLALQYFPNTTIDLIYGTPGLTDEKWRQNVDRALALRIPHLSCYALTVEPRTALDALIRKQKSPPVNTEDQARQFLLLMQWLREAGYDHYEISNFALPGHRSRHNSAYWKGIRYLGLGPSAHSYDGRNRQWNIANNALYIRSLQQDTVPFEKEELTEEQQFNEFVMIALRTMEGISLSVADRFGNGQFGRQLRSHARKYLQQQWLQEINDHYILTSAGKLFADGIAADLFV